MKKIAIVADSSIGISLEDQKNFKDLFIAPLSIIYNGKDYVDQIELSEEDIIEILKRNEIIQTSQPSVGACIQLLEKVHALGYDHIFVLPLTSHLSGTFNSFNTAKNDVDFGNITVMDTYTVAGVIQESIKLIHKLNALDASIEEITNELNTYYKDTVTYIIPETLDQLKASGRISAAAAGLASMLKMKILLRLENHGKTIDRFTTGRTDKKIYEAMFNDLEAHNFNRDEYVIYILHSDGLEAVERMTLALNDRFDSPTIYVGHLPAALSGHAGNGTVVVQLARKVS